MKTLLKRSLLALPLMMSLSLANPTEAAKGVVMDFGAVDTLKALDKTDAILALPVTNLPQYLGQIDQTNMQDSGGMKAPNLDLLTEIKPAFIVISPRLGGRVEELSQYAPVLNFTANPDDYYASVSQNILELAKLVDAETEANASLNALNTTLAGIKAEIAKSEKNALVVIHNDGKYGATPTSGSAKFIHQFLGVKNAETSPKEDRQAADVEYLETVKPDVIFIIDRSAAIGQTPMVLDTFKAEVTSKVTNGAGEAIEVVYLDPTLWYLSGNGLMSIEAQAKEIASALK